MLQFLRFGLVVALTLPLVLLSSEAWAISVFSRKYQTACTTCHFGAFPQLNAFGVAFRDRGYRIPPDDDVYVRETPVTMGVEPWKKLFPNAVWPAAIPGLPPLSIHTSSNFTFNPHRRTDTGKTGFDGVGEVGLLTSGTFGESLSFFGSMALFESNNFTPSRVAIDRWFFVYSPQLFGLPLGRVNFQVGRFDPRAAPFRDHVDLLTSGTVPDLANTWVVVPASNFTTFWPNQQGIELFGGLNGPGGKGGLRWAAGVVNGSPTDLAIEGFGGINTFPRLDGLMSVSAVSAAVEDKWSGKSDVNDAKDFYARLEYKIGGMGVLGSTTPETSLKMTQNWQDPSVTLGTFFYRGETGAFSDITPVDPTDPDAGVNGDFRKNANRFWRFGGEATVNWWNIQATGAATFYRDKVAGGVLAFNRAGNKVFGNNFDTDIYTFKLDYVALPWLIPSFRFENVNPRYDVADWPSFNRYTALLTALIRANVKVTLSGVFTDGIQGERVPALDNFYNLGLQFDF
ncbi:MAG TPA: hypothetical protein ACFYD3_09585 [Candidatus Hypogeohydataceae bacterium YC41]